MYYKIKFLNYFYFGDGVFLNKCLNLIKGTELNVWIGLDLGGEVARG